MKNFSNALFYHCSSLLRIVHRVMSKQRFDRHEPRSLEDLETIPNYNACKTMLITAISDTFFTKLQGINDQVSLQFSQGFDGKFTQVGDVVMAIKDKIISRATGLPLKGNKWFKNKSIDQHLSLQFLKPEYKSVDWEKGVPCSYIKDKWRSLLFILQKKITCEGRYAIVFLYHIRLLLHFSQDQKLKFPYYLWKSLQKMPHRDQKNFRNPYNSLYHYVLIKLLLEYELNLRHDSWSDFLRCNGFIPAIRVDQDNQNIQDGCGEEQLKRHIKENQQDDFFSSYPIRS